MSHTKLTLQSLANYHALSIVCKNRNPEFFETAQSILQAELFAKSYDDAPLLMDEIRDLLLSDDRHVAYEEAIKNCLVTEYADSFRPSPENIWTCITHGDCWVNNLLFHHDENGNPDDVKFIDFQLIQYNTCLRDLIYFLFTSCEKNALVSNFEELLTTYFDFFITASEKLKFDASQYTRKSFDEHLKFEARFMLAYLTLSLKFITFEVSKDFDPNDMPSLLTTKEFGKTFKDRISAVIRIFANKNWI